LYSTKFDKILLIPPNSYTKRFLSDGFNMAAKKNYPEEL